jgi:hypothetical protein
MSASNDSGTTTPTEAAADREGSGVADASAPATIPDYSTPARDRRAPTPMGGVAVVAVKLFGLYCLVQGLPLAYLIPADAYAMFRGPDFGIWEIAFNLMHPVVYIAAGVFLIYRADWVATRVLGFEPMSEADPARERQRGPGPGRTLQAIAFSVVGLWLVVAGLAEVVRLLVLARYNARYTGDDAIKTALEEPSSLIGAGVQVALGAWIFFGSKRLAAFWHRFRMRDVPPVTREP